MKVAFEVKQIGRMYFHEMKISQLYHKLLSKHKHTKDEFMKTLKLLFLALLFASCTAEEIEPQGQTCIKSYYTYKPVGYQGGTWVWDYVFEYSEATTLPATNGFVLINNSNYYKVECN